MPQRQEYYSSSSGLWCVLALGSEDWRHHASPAACKLQIAKSGWRPVISDRASVHVPTVISTPQRGRGHNSLPFEGSPAQI